MDKKIAALFTALVVLFSPWSQGHAAGSGVILGVVTGTKYKAMDAQQQQVWFVGALDGIMAESFSLFGELLRGKMLTETPDFYANNRGYDSWMGDCLAKYDIKQLQAVFQKKLESQPEAWHTPAALLVREAVTGICHPPTRPDIKGFPKP